MTYVEFRRHLGKAGLSIGEFAFLIGVRPDSVSNYSKKSDVPRTYAVIAVVLGDIADSGGDFRALLARFQIQSRAMDDKVAHLEDFRVRATSTRKK